MKTKQLAVTFALFAWAFVSILVFMSDDTPINPMSEQQFYVSKLASLASLGFCELARRFAKAKGYIYK